MNPEDPFDQPPKNPWNDPNAVPPPPQNQPYYQPPAYQPMDGNMGQTPLPNSIGVLVMGIISLLPCSIVSIVLGIIAIVMGNAGLREYNSNPGKYTESSYKNLKAGRICGMIGTIIWSCFLLIYLVVLMAGAAGGFR